MSFWVWYGLRNGIKTTRYPNRADSATGITPGRPIPTGFASHSDAEAAAANCPVDAIGAVERFAAVDFRKCVHCQRCHFGSPAQMEWDPGFEWTRPHQPYRNFEPLPKTFNRSLHIITVDAGDCGACLNEVKQLNNPFYNMHRLGFFFTATPRAADVLLVVGPVSENMRVPLLKTYEAMPDPKRVIAVGACAITGGIFGRTFASAGGVGSVLPVDLEVPGNPPPPLAILHGLLVVTGRKSPIDELTTASTGERK
jgi:Ni,Fe-hydrogenase III small subunit